jgi:hypothetical protein
LKEQVRGSEHRIRQTDRYQKYEENRRNRVCIGSRFHRFRKDRAENDQNRRSEEKRPMNKKLRKRSALRGNAVRIQVSPEEKYLEKEYAYCPDRGGSAEPRENEFADDGLYLKNEKRPKTHCENEKVRIFSMHAEFLPDRRQFYLNE